MTPRHAANALGFLQRAQPYLVMNGQEAMVFAETVQMLQGFAQAGNDAPPEGGNDKPDDDQPSA